MNSSTTECIAQEDLKSGHNFAAAKWSEWCVAVCNSAPLFVHQAERACMRASTHYLSHHYIRIVIMSCKFQVVSMVTLQGSGRQGRKLTPDRRWRTIFIARGRRGSSHLAIRCRITLEDLALASRKSNNLNCRSI